LSKEESVTGWLVLFYLLEVAKWLVIVRAVASWFTSPYSRNPLLETLRRITDPILEPIRAVLPAMGGVDLSPLVAFFLILVLQSLIRTAAF
jgi:YggT family protein